MDTLLQEYQEQLKRTRAPKRSLPNEDAEDKNRHKIISGMITDLEIAVNWLETGIPYRPRGIYRTSLDFESGSSKPLSDVNRMYKKIDPFDIVETAIDADLERGKKLGMNTQETYAYTKWARSKRRVASNV